VHDAFKPKERGDCGGRDAVLPRSGFRNNAMLAHAFYEQRLAQAVIDLVRAGVQQVFALQVNLRSPEMFAETLREKEWSRTARVVVQEIGQARMKFRITASALVGLLQFRERSHQGLRDVAAAIRAKTPDAITRRACLPLLRRPINFSFDLWHATPLPA